MVFPIFFWLLPALFRASFQRLSRSPSEPRRSGAKLAKDGSVSHLRGLLSENGDVGANHLLESVSCRRRATKAQHIYMYGLPTASPPPGGG